MGHGLTGSMDQRNVIQNTPRDMDGDRVSVKHRLLKYHDRSQ